jgi:hypothetical protein
LFIIGVHVSSGRDTLSGTSVANVLPGCLDHVEQARVRISVMESEGNSRFSLKELVVVQVWGNGFVLLEEAACFVLNVLPLFHGRLLPSIQMRH